MTKRIFSVLYKLSLTLVVSISLLPMHHAISAELKWAAQNDILTLDQIGRTHV